MFFNHPMFTGLYPSSAFSPIAFGGVSPLASWGGYFPPPMYPSYANWSMGQSSGWLQGGWHGGHAGYGGYGSHGGYGGYGGYSGPGVHPMPGQGAAGHVGGEPAPGTGAYGPREGGWSTRSGGYVVGGSGRLQVDFKGGESRHDSMVQYRTGDGAWTDLDRAKSAKDTTRWIEATPGSTVQFRIKTPDGTAYQAGTQSNPDNRDHGRTTATDRGVKLAFEDWTDSDFNDAEIEISDAKRLR